LRYVSTETAYRTSPVDVHSSCLSAGYRCHAALKESECVQYKKTVNDVTEQGSVTISCISLSLKKDFSKMINSSKSNKLCMQTDRLFNRGIMQLVLFYRVQWVCMMSAVEESTVL
jgi:hypothetical protein